jgi:hypothetical protein
VGWKCLDRKAFKRDHNADLTSAALHRGGSLMVVGFDNGVFGLYEMPGEALE